MKKSLVTLFALVMIATAVSASEGIDPKILSAFEKEFSFAKNARWETNGQYVQVNFLLNDQGFVAWYNSNAELIATARNILYMQLPLTVIRSLEQEYAGADFAAIEEYTRGEETFYRMQATTTTNRKLLLRASQSGNITVIKKIK